MREKLARALALFSGVLIVLATLGFGAIQNFIYTTGSATASPEDIAAGKALYEAQGCALCHSIAGEGDPEHALDGIGARLNAAQLRLRVAPTEEMKTQFPAAVYEMKQTYRELPEDDLNRLIDYLQSLR